MLFWSTDIYDPPLHLQQLSIFSTLVSENYIRKLEDKVLSEIIHIAAKNVECPLSTPLVHSHLCTSPPTAMIAPQIEQASKNISENGGQSFILSNKECSTECWVSTVSTPLVNFHLCPSLPTAMIAPQIEKGKTSLLTEGAILQFSEINLKSQ